MLNCHKWILRKPRLIREAEGYTLTIKQVSISVNVKETNI